MNRQETANDRPLLRSARELYVFDEPEVTSVQELSVANGIVGFVCEQLPQSPEEARRVSVVRLRVGILNGVAAPALKSAFRSAVANTPLHGARLEVESTDLVVWCAHCHQEQLLESATLRCPVCQSRTPRIVQGNELEIESVEFVESASACAWPRVDLPVG